MERGGGNNKQTGPTDFPVALDLLVCLCDLDPSSGACFFDLCDYSFDALGCDCWPSLSQKAFPKALGTNK